MTTIKDTLANKISELAGIDIFKNTRKQEYVDARALFIFLAYNVYKYKLHEIEKYFISRGKLYNHATVLYALKNFNNYRKFNKKLDVWLCELTDQDTDTIYKKNVIIQNIKTLRGEQIKELYPIVQEMYNNKLQEV